MPTWVSSAAVRALDQPLDEAIFCERPVASLSMFLRGHGVMLEIHWTIHCTRGLDVTN